MNNAPKKFTKINGITKLNPEYKRWKEAFGDAAAGQTNKVSKVTINIYAASLVSFYLQVSFDSDFHVNLAKRFHYSTYTNWQHLPCFVAPSRRKM